MWLQLNKKELTAQCCHRVHFSNRFKYVHELTWDILIKTLLCSCYKSPSRVALMTKYVKWCSRKTLQSFTMKPNNSRQVITAKQERASEEDILSQFFIQIQLRNQAPLELPTDIQFERLLCSHYKSPSIWLWRQNVKLCFGKTLK